MTEKDRECKIKIIEFIIKNNKNQFIVQQKIKNEVLPNLELNYITYLFNDIIKNSTVKNRNISNGRIGLKYDYGLEDYLLSLKNLNKEIKPDTIIVKTIPHKKKQNLSIRISAWVLDKLASFIISLSVALIVLAITFDWYNIRTIIESLINK